MTFFEVPQKIFTATHTGMVLYHVGEGGRKAGLKFLIKALHETQEQEATWTFPRKVILQQSILKT
jgi:hypothetical protein